MTLVESSLPPKPTSITETSTFSSLKITSESSVINSKKEGL